MNKSKVKVSVVMPILNTVNYIRECMDSLVNQTLTEIEILCVDANSTDGTREILQEYVDRDSRVRLLTDTKGSSGYANNHGMTCATGEYVAIVEPDDFVALDMYERLYAIATEHDADIVRADYKVFFGDGEEREYIEKAIAGKEEYGKVLNPTDQQKLFQNDMSTWAGIYKRSFVLENHICHNETPGAAYQDNGFWFLAMSHAKSLYYAPVSGYRYRMDNPNSSVHNRGKIYAICDEYEFIADKLKQSGIFEAFKDVYIWAKIIRYLSSYYRLDDSLKEEFAERFAKEVQEHDLRGGLDKGMFSQGQQNLIEKLLISGGTFHKYIAEQKDIFFKLMESNQTLVQYGCGSDGFRLLNYARGKELLHRVSCLCDSNSGLWGTEVFGKKICSPEEIKQNYPDAMYLIASINYGDEIKESLIHKGIDVQKVWCVNFC